MGEHKLSNKWKVVIIVVPAAVVLALVGGAAAARAYFAGNPSACGNCHVMQTFVQSYYGSNFLDHTHAGGQSVKCEDCHQQSLTQQAGELLSYLKGNYVVSPRDVDTQAACTSCHHPDQVIAAAKAVPAFIANPELSYHITAESGKACGDPRGESVKCQDCHKSHDSGVNYCASCHTPTFGAPPAGMPG